MKSTIKGIVIEIAGTTSKLVASLNDADTAIRKTQGEVKALDKLLKFDPSNVELLSQKQQTLTDAVGKTKEKLDTLKEASRQAEQQLSQGTLGKDRYTALQQEIIRTEQELSKLVDASVKSNTTLNALGSVGTTLTNVGGAMTRAGKTLTTSLTLPTVAIGTAAVKTGMDFDASMSKVKAISGATGEDMDKLRAKAREMGAKTAFSAKEAADAFGYMAMAGWKPKEMMQGLSGVMNLAAASGESLASTSDIVTDAITAFGLKAQDSNRFANVLAATASNSNTNVRMLGESFKYVATTAGSFKFSIEDTALALGLAANNGVKGTMAGTSLKNALVNLTKPTKQQTEAMMRLGFIETEYVKKVDSKKVESAQRRVEDYTRKLSDARERYNNVLSGAGTSTASAISAHNSLIRNQEKVEDATKKVADAQKAYDTALKEHGAKSKQAEDAQKKLKTAQKKLRDATMNLNVAEARNSDLQKQSSADSPKAVAARKAIETAERNLTRAQQDLATASKGVMKEQAGRNKLMTDEQGNVRDLDSILRLLRATLGQTNVSLTDSNGELREFDDVLKDAAASGASLTQIQKLQDAAIIFCKQNMSGMLAIVNSSEEDYNKLSTAIRNSSYNFQDMGNKLKDVKGIDWAKLFNKSSMDKVADEQFAAVAQKVTKILEETGKTPEGLKTAAKTLLSEYKGMSGQAATSVVEAVASMMEKSKGTAETIAETMLDNLKGKFTILKSALQELAIQISDALKPTISGIVSSVQAFVEKLQKMDDSTRDSILRWGLFLAAIGPVLTIVGKMTSGFGLLFTATSRIGEGVLTLWKQYELGIGLGSKLGTMFSTLTSGPVALIIAAVAALAAGFVYLWNTNEDFRNKCIAIWESVKTAFKGLWDTISLLLQKLTPLFNVAVAAIKVIWEQFCRLLAPLFEGAFKVIKAVLETVVGVLSGILKTFIGLFTGDWKTFWEGIKTIFSSLWNGLKDILSAAFTVLKGLVSTFFSWLSAFWKAGWTGIKAIFEMLWNMIKSVFSVSWNGLKTIVSTVWDAIKDYVKVALLAIGSLIDAAFKIITLPFRFIWENCKDTVLGAWTKIKNGVSESLSLVAGLIKKTWEGTKSLLSSVCKAIADYVISKWQDIKDKVTELVGALAKWLSEKWTAIKNALSPIVQAIKDFVSEKWNALKTSVTSITDAISTYVSDKWKSIKDYTSSIWSGIKDYIAGIWDSIKESISTKVTGIWDKVKSVFGGIWDTIKGIVDKLKSAFTFEWSLPKIKLPHFKIKGEFSLNPPSVPYLSIDWYKKAMNDAYILSSPTIFGASGGRLLGGGEAGSEAVVGTDKLTEIVRSAISSVVGNGSTVIPVYIGQERIEEIVIRANKSVNYRSGGR